MAGLVSGAVALGIAQLVAAVVRPESFPVVAVGDAVVDLTPVWLKEWAISTFGENDKNVLMAGVFAVLVVIAAGLGVLARRSLGLAQAGFALIAVVGVAAALTRPQAGSLDVLPTVVGVGAGIWTLGWLLRRAVADTSGAVPSGGSMPEGGAGPAPEGGGGPAPEGGAGPAQEGGGPGAPAAGSEGGGGPGGAEIGPERQVRPVGAQRFDRRRLLVGAAGGVLVAGATAVAGRLWAGAQSLEAVRAGLRFPIPAVPARPLPAGVDLRMPGLTPFVTPNSDFYRVDTALILPRVDPRSWTLRVHGMVDRPVELTFDDLLRRPLVEADVTLACVSNEVGGDLTGNARWLGARLADVLREAGVRSGADMLLSTSADGWTCGTPVDVVMDGRDALLAVAMNGEALPQAHGFPVRQVVPGLYGYVSATKWVVDIKVTRFDIDEAYWTSRGWSAKGPIKTESRIDVPGAGATVRAGRTAIAGVAWAQHKGIAAVEVRIDGGEWQRARLAEVTGPDTWRQWTLDWDAVAGRHTVQVRATDATGYTQTAVVAPPAPDGASGWHTISVTVEP
ncbi:hypothetical protein GCM10009560_77290 [Nonomuraea longicatena]|uniref:Oxidoreductase molybdopterin-binding domain-containing protein n=1 Tax=Nonomuraea longicatena TaxID=83682 RepID=A0ABN1RAC2_9ACTN